MKKRFFAIILLLSFSILTIFVNFKSYSASASGETEIDITSNYIFNLPSVSVSLNGTTTPCTIPNIFVCFDSSRNFQCIYTPYFTVSRNNLKYLRRDFTFGNGVYSSAFTLSLYTNNTSNTLSYNYKNQNVVAKRIYTRPSTDFLKFSIGQFTITTSTELGKYTCNYTLTDSSGAYFHLEFDIVQNDSMLFDYSFTFSPVSFVGGLVGQNYQLGFENGYDKGYDEGEDYGYQNGLRDGSVLTNQSFTSLITAVVDVPINSFKSLLNFDFLGINLLDFVLSLLTFILVIKVIQIIKGG